MTTNEDIPEAARACAEELNKPIRAVFIGGEYSEDREPDGYEYPSGKEQVAIIARHMTDLLAEHKIFALARFVTEAHIWLTEVGAPQGELPERMRWAAERMKELESERDRLIERLSEATAYQSDLRMQADGCSNGSIDQRPSILTTAKFCRELSRTFPHSEAVSDCSHCNLNYAANSLERLVQACTAVRQRKEEK